MGKWKYSELNNRKTDEFNSKPLEEKKEINNYCTNMQLLTIRQLIEIRKRQHKKELNELYDWENNVAKELERRI